MVVDSDSFIFQAPPEIARARRVLLKPPADSAEPYPASTSRLTLAALIDGIRHISEADIILLEGANPHLEGVNSYGAAPARFRQLGYDFPRVITMDVADCPLVEVENPLPKPFALPSVWIPNVLLSCDYLISVTPFQTGPGGPYLSLGNLLGLLPATKYARGDPSEETLRRLGLDRVIADLYFTLPFDLGIIEDHPLGNGDMALPWGRLFISDPYQADCEAAAAASLRVEYLNLIASAKAETIA